MLRGCIYLVVLVLRLCLSAPTISWDDAGNEEKGEPWYFQGDYPGKNWTSQSKSRTVHGCIEPRNLPEQFMTWFRESQSDATMLTFMSDMSEQLETERTLESLREEPALCLAIPSTAPDSRLMERALCPWEWRLNRDENREPKLISEAHCLCRRARGELGADCMPIRREFPVLKRIYCDEEKGRFEYARAFETVTVGCHSVMPRVSRALPLSRHLRHFQSLP